MTDEVGQAEFPGQPAGLYRLGVTDQEGNRWVAHEQEVKDPASAWIQVETDAVLVEGRVFIGENVLSEALLLFGTRHGALRAKAETDPDGRFMVVLPKSGFWPVEVLAEEPPVQVAAKLTVEEGLGRRASVEIHLPETRLAGRVVDPSGKPAPYAEVVFHSLTIPVAQRLKVDMEGRFQYSGVAEGPGFLTADAFHQGAHWESQPRQVEVREGAFPPLVELVLEENREVKGKVLGPNGPVVGAAISISRTASRPATSAPALTDTEGRFSARLSFSDPRASVTLSPPGYAFDAFDVPTDAGPVTLTASSQMGTLVLLSPPIESASSITFVRRNGTFLSLLDLAKWSSSGKPFHKGTKLEAQGVGVGLWQLCSLPSPEHLDLSTFAWVEQGLLPLLPIANCVAGHLEHGGTLVLRLADSQHNETRSATTPQEGRNP